MTKAHGKQDHTRLFELSCSLHGVALGLSIRQNNDNLGCVAGVAASRQTLPQHILERQARLGAASSGRSKIGEDNSFKPGEEA